MFLRPNGVDVAFAVDVFRVFVVFFCVFSKKVSSNSRGVVQQVKQKLRQPFLP